MNNTVQKIKIGMVIPYNSSYKYSLYAVFDYSGKFLYFKYSNIISCFIDDLLEEKISILNCDVNNLRKFEKLV